MSFNILLTGGAGYIGSHVAHLLIDEGHSVSIIDSLITGNKKLVPSKAKLNICDIADKDKIYKIIEEENFDLVMHFAGLIRVDESVKEPKKYNDYNYEKSKIFLDICFKSGLDKIIFSSTASVYGNPKKDQVSENDEMNPLNPYALSKLNLENFLIEKSKQLSIKYIILRYFNVAGAEKKMRTGLISKFSTHLIKVACEVAKGKKKELIINGDDYDTIDGTPVRDYIHISDLADIHLLCAEDLMRNHQSNIFNCGYGQGFSVKEVLNTLNTVLKFNISTKIGPRRPLDSKYVVANSDKFKNYFSWKPKYNNLKYILETALEWEEKIK
jgi:UDP-glucose 4-epimerase